MQTKSGQLPDPAQLVDAAGSIARIGQREREKEAAFLAQGEAREAWLASVEARIGALKPTIQAAQAQVDALEAKTASGMEATLAPLSRREAEARESASKAQAQRLASLKQGAAALRPGDVQAHHQYIEAYREHLAKTEAEQAHLGRLKEAKEQATRQASPELAAAQRTLARQVEERQHLERLLEQLGKSNREARVLEGRRDLAQAEAAFINAAPGPAKFQQAGAWVRALPRLEKLEGSEPVFSYTLQRQVVRSVFCVFVGFVFGTAIAVPAGILCGLSPTFMAAMTPFIAVFKPVSPIIWVIVALIVVGGMIPDPENHGLLRALWGLPLIGWMRINPAFIASALTVAMCSLWATLVNTALGVASIDKDHLNVARVLRLDFRARLFKIIIPSSLPLIFAGLRISLGVGWMVLIAAELLSSSEGIGKYVWDQFNNGASDSFAKILVCVFVVGVIGLMLDRVMIVLQRLVSFDGAPAAL